MSNLTIRDRSVLILAATTLFTPIFIGAGTGGVELSGQYTGELSGRVILPISTWLFAVLALLVLIYRGFKVPSFDINLGAPILVFFIASCGYFLGNTLLPGDTSLGRYIQTIAPISFLYLGHILFSRFCIDLYPFAVLYFLKIATLVLLIWQLGYVFTTALEGPDTHFSLLASHVGPFFNLKVKRFYPIILCYVALFAFTYLLHNKKNRLLYSSYFIFLALSISLYWSRTSMLVFILGLGYAIWINSKVLNRAFLLVAVGVMLLLSILFFTSILHLVSANVFEDGSAIQRSIATLNALFSGGAANSGDVVRLNRILAALNGVFATPFGDGFRVYYQDLVLNKDILVAENGYLDLGVRIGVLGLLLPGYLLYGKYQHALTWKTSIGVDERILATFFRAFIISSAFGSVFWLHQLTEPYAGAVLFFLLGSIRKLQGEGSS